MRCMMNIAAKKESNALVVTVSGRMDAVTAPEFEKSIAAFIAQGEKAFVINLSGLEYISSAGLRSILHAAHRRHGACPRRGGHQCLKICEPRESRRNRGCLRLRRREVQY